MSMGDLRGSLRGGLVDRSKEVNRERMEKVEVEHEHKHKHKEKIL